MAKDNDKGAYRSAGGVGPVLLTRFDTAMQRLSQFARYAVGRIIGSKPKTNGAYKQLVSTEEARLIHRAELTALVGLLIKKRIITEAEWLAEVASEAELLAKTVQQVFPECVPFEDGLGRNLDVAGFKKRVDAEEWPP